MKVFFRPVLLCLALPLMAAPRRPSPAREAQAAIQAIYDRQAAAVARKDEGGVLAGCAPDYREVHTEPEVRGMSFTVAQLRPMIHSMLFFARTATRRTTIEGISFLPGGVSVTVHQHMVVWMHVPKQHKDAQIFVNTVSTDTWVKGPGGWQEKQSLILSGQNTGYLYDTGQGKLGRAGEARARQAFPRQTDSPRPTR